MENVINVVKELNKIGKVFLVGGFVRDTLLDIPNKDIDFEVYGIPAEKLLHELKKFGKAELVGKQFGCFKLWVDGKDYDFSLPRTEEKEGKGHKGFKIESDCNMQYEIACKRRDITINSILIDPLSLEFIDPFNGMDDIKNKIIRHTSIHFNEDPLRVLRIARFSAKLDWDVNEKTLQLCEEMVEEGKTLPEERIWGELKNTILSCKNISRFFNVLKETNWISLFPSFEKLIGLEQNPKWHPEGDVWNHTLINMEKMIDICNREYLSDDERIVLLISVMFHDIGKIITTTTKDDGKIISYGHSQVHEEFIFNAMDEFGIPKKIQVSCIPLIREHMIKASCSNNCSVRLVKRLAKRLLPQTIKNLCYVMEADNNDKIHSSDFITDLLKLSEEEGLLNGGPTQIIMGKDLIKLGYKPGKEMGIILKKIFSAQLDGCFHNYEDGIHWVVKHKKRLLQ